MGEESYWLEFSYTSLFTSLFSVALPFDFLIRMFCKLMMLSQENIVQDHSFFLTSQ